MLAFLPLSRHGCPKTLLVESPGNGVPLSWHVPLHQLRDFSQGERGYFGLVSKGPLTYTLCLAFLPYPLLLIPPLS